MAYEKLAKLVTLLSLKTQDGELQWEATADANTFQVAFPENVVQISGTQGETSYGQEYTLYTLKILNAENLLMEEVTQHDLKENFSDAYKVMSGLYVAARRQALGVEQALDSLLETLGEKPVGGFRSGNPGGGFSRKLPE